MARYIIKRLMLGILTVIVVMTLNFLLIHLAPGDPTIFLVGRNAPNPALREALMEKYGLNDSLFVQYTRMIKQYLSGDLGDSIIFHRPVSDMIFEKLGPTLLLVLTSSFAALLLGTAAGVVSARREGRLFDTAFSGGVYVINAMPSFWLGLMLIIVFATRLGWFPTSGMTNLRATYTGFAHYLDIARHMFLPWFTLVLLDIPPYFRIAKTSMLQVNNEEYIMTFRAAGMSERRIFRKYILKNAILPVITMFGITMAYLIVGVSLIEIVFAWPGTGRVMLSAVSQRDYPVLMGMYLIMSVMIVLTMLLIDIIYAVLDPRIRY